MAYTEHEMRQILVVLAVILTLVPMGAQAYGNSGRSKMIVLPATNIPTGGWAVGDGYAVYAVADPPLQPQAPRSGQVFDNFVTRVHVVRLTSRSTPDKVSDTVAIVGPRGVGIFPHQVSAGWLFMTEARVDDPAATWLLIAYSLATGRSILLDSSAREGLAGVSSRAQSDGRMVVWSAWTMSHGQPASVIRAYDLATGQRSVVAEGGSLTSWAYYWPAVAGRWVVFERDIPARQRAQILLADLTTRHVRILTPPSQVGSEPSIAGNLIVWKEGWRFGVGQGVTAYTLQNADRRHIYAGAVEQPQVVATDHIVFVAGISPWRIMRFDTRTGRLMTLVSSALDSDGYVPGNGVMVGDHMVAYGLEKYSTGLIPNPMRVVILTLP